MKGPIETAIEERIRTEFAPEYMELANESHTHNVPANSETHFRLVVVSEAFCGLSRVARQRRVSDVLKDLMKPGGVHALTQKTMTPTEWKASGETSDSFVSPNCHGGSKR